MVLTVLSSSSNRGISGANQYKCQFLSSLAKKTDNRSLAGSLANQDQGSFSDHLISILSTLFSLILITRISILVSLSVSSQAKLGTNTNINEVDISNTVTVVASDSDSSNSPNDSSHTPVADSSDDSDVSNSDDNADSSHLANGQDSDGPSDDRAEERDPMATERPQG
jgi:hypothetical protein